MKLRLERSYAIVLLFFLFFLSLFYTIVAEPSSGVVAPRMDYDQWTPLGRGDPLNNDPTFDYAPPILDRVLYWAATSRPPDLRPYRTIRPPYTELMPPPPGPSSNPSPFRSPTVGPIHYTQMNTKRVHPDVSQALVFSTESQVIPAPSTTTSTPMTTEATKTSAAQQQLLTTMMTTKTTKTTTRCSEPILQRQVTEPVRLPPLQEHVYLIIQGHSKVKKYGPKSRDLHTISNINTIKIRR